LIHETSPYLLQHAHNPVDWYAWGEDAFEKAKAEGKPILLSIGYSACHWCHVMERESFENEAIARLLNELFVNIKVDREERPDLDEIYMSAVQMLTGRGGWPARGGSSADRSAEKMAALPPIPVMTWSAIVRRAIASDDDHVIKLVHACHGAAQRKVPGPFLAAAARAAV